ncbi:hypothetical protein FQN54_006627 [Arachnomyces sp. PD_36]|nr:hypothetical protein FQN54_006627 [Arachnomyces sp. PD_36]
MSNVVAAWVFASTALASSHFQVRGKTHSIGLNGEPSCPPDDKCDAGSNRGSRSPLGGNRSCTTWPSSPTTGSSSISAATSSNPVSSPSACPPYSSSQEPDPTSTSE